MGRIVRQFHFARILGILGLFALGDVAVLGQAPVALANLYRFGVEIRQSEHGLRFEFYDISRQTDPPRRVPIKVIRLLVFKRLDPFGWNEEYLWRISSPPYSEAATSRITYGILPPGWTQELPAEGPPRPLEPGDEYFIYAQDERAMAAAPFTYRGP